MYILVKFCSLERSLESVSALTTAVSGGPCAEEEGSSGDHDRVVVIVVRRQRLTPPASAGCARAWSRRPATPCACDAAGSVRHGCGSRRSRRSRSLCCVSDLIALRCSSLSVSLSSAVSPRSPVPSLFSSLLATTYWTCRRDKSTLYVVVGER